MFAVAINGHTSKPFHNTLEGAQREMVAIWRQDQCRSIWNRPDVKPRWVGNSLFWDSQGRKVEIERLL